MIVRTLTFWSLVLSALAAPLVPYQIPIEGTRGHRGKFLHVTDIHIDPTYIPGSDPTFLCHRKNDNDTTLNVAGRFGALGKDCDSPVELVDAAFDFMKRNFSDEIDFVIYTGDTARHDRDAVKPRTEFDVLADHAAILNHLTKSFDTSKIRIFPTIGNNDVFNHDQMPYGEQPLTQNLTKLWEPLGLNLQEDEDFQIGGYYTREITPTLSIVSLNTMHLYKNNVLAADCNARKSAGTKMLKWFEKILKKARRDGRKIYVIGHVPPHNDEGHHAYHLACYNDYIYTLGTHYEVIAGQFFGHTNDDTIAFLHAHHPNKGPFHLETIIDKPPNVDLKTHKILHVISTAPSIIPFNNPAVRVYEYEKRGGRLVDYVQYWTDLNEDEQRGRVEFVEEYAASKAYGLKDLTTKSWIGLLKTLERNGTEMELAGQDDEAELGHLAAT
ncbi:Endopolyphosphatase [Rhizophlyctis rosea]|uniref:Endopolyphosphatase n=1 Tax=Rhizophlyctis rosea TaxID=64517 RepID=A0AAD5X4E1_9FUNG|nr:Endopolyphosphatase [Rhizophlyctis rosea]